jgi:hypothetical protein
MAYRQARCARQRNRKKRQLTVEKTMVQLLADGIFYLIILSGVVSLFTSAGQEVDSDAKRKLEEDELDWHANKVNPNSPNYRYK